MTFIAGHYCYSTDEFIVHILIREKPRAKVECEGCGCTLAWHIDNNYPHKYVIEGRARRKLRGLYDL